MKTKPVILAGLILIGCAQKRAVDTRSLERDFPAATVSNIVTAIARNDYPKAMVALQKLSHQPQLTAAQQRALRDTMSQVQEKMTEAAVKARFGAH